MKEEKQQHQEVLLTFLKQTKEGKYAKIDECSLNLQRIKEQSEDVYCEDEEFQYSIS